MWHAECRSAECRGALSGTLKSQASLFDRAGTRLGRSQNYPVDLTRTPKIRKLWITDMSVPNLLGLALRRNELEIRSDIIAQLVFS